MLVGYLQHFKARYQKIKVGLGHSRMNVIMSTSLNSHKEILFIQNLSAYTVVGKALGIFIERESRVVVIRLLSMTLW